MADSNMNRRRFLSHTASVAAGAVLGAGAADAKQSRPSDGSAEEGTGAGILVRGADGVLYFIPDTKLGPFRLPTAKAEALRKLIDLRGTCKLLPGAVVNRVGLTAKLQEAYYVNLGAMGQRKR